ncbi:ferredoxin--NADP reductase [Alkalimonas collagenimarina]|uniref:ferredoxin--NADP(+) reductase n=1 Tax=Alkalimonas collagenimarina TaxID=400390 RepID=A0ABT9GZ00_9GAMM|nr:ferredoxin--NADP reductase [Alkalimonas collagenimarina]MDP4536248.1 ferredoxin--NADP reductase [Alkalimonas collagenimarina]
MANWLEAKVAENVAWNPTLCSVRVELPGFDFIAGQFVRLAVETDEGRMQRAYSLVNAPGDPRLDFLLTPVADGKVSPRLHALQAGDAIWVSQPATGFFTLSEVPDGKVLWLIGTGTGIGPYLSMLATAEPWLRFNRVVLVHGVRHAEDLVYSELIQRWRQQYPQQFHYQPVVTRQHVPGALSERLPQLIQQHKLQEAAGAHFDQDSQVMLCGNPDMIKDVRSELEQLGLQKNLRRTPGHITVEQYWN